MTDQVMSFVMPMPAFTRTPVLSAKTMLEDVGPFVDKLVRSGEPNPAASTRHKRNFPVELAHVSSPSAAVRGHARRDETTRPVRFPRMM